MGDTMHYALLAIALLLASTSCQRAWAGPGAFGNPGDAGGQGTEGASATGEGVRRTTHQVPFRRRTREYVLYRPEAAVDGEKAPLMIVLHGGGGNAKHVEQSTGMSSVADRGGFLVIYPEGTAAPRGMGKMRTWNAGICCGPAMRFNVDDVGFLGAVIDEAVEKHGADPKRVYVAGMSNGAMMAYRLACETPERIAAIVAVSGTSAVEDCSGAKDVAVLHIHGDEDENVPLAGGRGKDSLTGVDFRPVQAAIDALLAQRGDHEEQLDETNGVRRTAYVCDDGAPVELVVLKGSGHTWPGGVKDAGGSYSASENAWAFVSQFTKED